MQPDETRAPRQIQAVDRALRLLRAVGSGDLTVPELAGVVGINRTTAWRLLATLEHHGLIERDPSTQRYTLGYEVVILAAAARAHPTLIARSRPYLEVLAAETGETVNLSIAQHGTIVTLDQVDGSQVVTVNWVGRPLPLHSTSVGKAYLAWLPPFEVDAILGQGLKRFTRHTLTRRGALDLELRRIRDTGLSYTIGEYEEGLVGVTAPVVDAQNHHPIFLSISGPEYRIGSERLEGFGRRLRCVADELGALLLPR